MPKYHVGIVDGVEYALWDKSTGYGKVHHEPDDAEMVALVRSEAKESRIAELKKLLANSDYISCKIAEGAATKEEYADVITQRQAWRDEINQLEEVSQ